MEEGSPKVGGILEVNKNKSKSRSPNKNDFYYTTPLCKYVFESKHHYNACFVEAGNKNQA